jgi:hypothetical protein
MGTHGNTMGTHGTTMGQASLKEYKKIQKQCDLVILCSEWIEVGAVLWTLCMPCGDAIAKPH